MTRDYDHSILNVSFKSTSPSSLHLVLVPIDHRDRHGACSPFLRHCYAARVASMGPFGTRALWSERTEDESDISG